MAIAIRRFRSSTYSYSQFIPTGWLEDESFTYEPIHGTIPDGSPLDVP
jgi:hypothetical protein